MGGATPPIIGGYKMEIKNIVTGSVVLLKEYGKHYVVAVENNPMYVKGVCYKMKNCKNGRSVHFNGEVMEKYFERIIE